MRCDTNVCCPPGTYCEYQDGNTYCASSVTDGDSNPKQTKKQQPINRSLRSLQDLPTTGTVSQHVITTKGVTDSGSGELFGVCLCSTTTCYYNELALEDINGYIFTHSLYSRDDMDCSGNSYYNSTLVYPYSFSTVVVCPTLQEFPSTVEYTITGESESDYKSLYGSGKFSTYFLSPSDCQSDSWYKYSFDRDVTCAQNNACYGNISIAALSSDSSETTVYSDNTCSSIIEVSFIEELVSFPIIDLAHAVSLLSMSVKFLSIFSISFF